MHLHLHLHPHPPHWHHLPWNHASGSHRNHYILKRMWNMLIICAYILVYYYQIMRKACNCGDNVRVGAVGVHSCELGVSHAVRQQKVVKIDAVNEENKNQNPERLSMPITNDPSMKNAVRHSYRGRPCSLICSCQSYSKKAVHSMEPLDTVRKLMHRNQTKPNAK